MTVQLSPRRCKVRSFLIAVAGLSAAACTTQSGEQTASANVRYSAHAESRLYEQREEQAKALFATLHGETPESIVLRETTVSRIAIGASAPVSVARHEESAGARTADIEKTQNVASGLETKNILQEIQNGVIDNGWRQTEAGLIHLPSGMTCPGSLAILLVDQDTGEEATLEAPIAGVRLFDESGFDTACDYQDAAGEAYLTFYASRWPQTSLSDHYSAALKLIVDRFAIAEEAELIAPEITLEGVGEGYDSTIEAETMSAGFHLTAQEGVTGKTALWLNKTGDWHIKARATYVVAKDGGAPMKLAPAEFMAAIFHAASLHTVDAHINKSGAVQVRYETGGK